MLRYGLALLLLLYTSAASLAAQPMPFSTDSLAGMALSKSGGPVGDIAFAHKGDIYTVTLDGKHLRRLTEDGLSASPMWSRDGSRIAFTKGSPSEQDNWNTAELWIATPDGKYSHLLTKPEQYTAIFPVAWLPADEGLLVARRYLESDISPTLEVVTRDGKPYRHMAKWMETSKRAKFAQWFTERKEFTPGEAADFSSDGRQIIFTAATKWWVDMPQPDLYRMNVDGSGLRRLQEMPETYIRCLRWNDRPDRILSVESGRGEDSGAICLRDGIGKRLRKLAEVGAPGHNLLGWSPDGKQIIYTLTDDKYRDWHPSTFAEMSDHCSLWVMNADGSGKYKLADNACTPSWR
jgi:Tol biopolymer transport system component